MTECVDIGLNLSSYFAAFQTQESGLSFYCVILWRWWHNSTVFKVVSSCFAAMVSICSHCLYYRELKLSKFVGDIIDIVRHENKTRALSDSRVFSNAVTDS